MIRINHQKILLLVLFEVLLAGCTVPSFFESIFPPEVTNQDQEVELASQLDIDQISTQESTPSFIESGSITVWLLPQFDPNNETEAGRVMLAHIGTFEETFPNSAINIRIKAESGPSSIINSLQVTAKAAPSALPSVVLLQRPDLEAAAASGTVSYTHLRAHET